MIWNGMGIILQSLVVQPNHFLLVQSQEWKH